MRREDRCAWGREAKVSSLRAFRAQLRNRNFSLGQRENNERFEKQ